GLGLATLLCGPLALGEPRLTGRAVPPLVRGVLLEILQAAKLESVQVTSTSRTAAEQAKVMFDYINRSGYQAALDLYGPHGDEIVKVCTESYRKHERCVDSVLPEMVQETRNQIALLEKQGDRRTELMHTSDTHYTIDIDPDSVSDREAFEKAVVSHRGVSRFLKPPLDRNSYHLELPRPDA